MSTPAPEIVRPSFLAPIIWAVVGLLGTCAGVGVLGIGIADSESSGIVAAMAVSAPLGFVWAGAIGAIGIHFVQKATPPVRIGTPFGCGCLGSLFMGMIAFVFFAAIFPAL